jgi:predicted  nucleic acid-binding Zn-ribbon protein
MPTQEERLSTLEQTVTVLGNGIRDLNHHTTILLGVAREQGKDIREMKGSLVALGQRLDAFEQKVDNRFEALDGRVGGLDSRIGALEQSVNSRFDEQGKKLDQVLLILNTLTSR